MDFDDAISRVLLLLEHTQQPTQREAPMTVLNEEIKYTMELTENDIAMLHTAMRMAVKAMREQTLQLPEDQCLVDCYEELQNRVQVLHNVVYGGH